MLIPGMPVTRCLASKFFTFGLIVRVSISVAPLGKLRAPVGSLEIVMKPAANGSLATRFIDSNQLPTTAHTNAGPTRRTDVRRAPTALGDLAAALHVLWAVCRSVLWV